MMNDPTQTTQTEIKINRILLHRRIGVTLAIGAAFFLLFYLLESFLRRPAAPVFETPSYGSLNPQALDYWSERTQRNIDQVKQSKLSSAKKEEYFRFLVFNDLKEVQKITASFDRIRTIGEIALTLARNDVDINIDNTIRSLDEGHFASSIRGRINVSLALMYIRLKKPVAARVALTEYKRQVISADLKLDTDVDTASFHGAVKALSCLEDTEELRELFNRNIAYSYRLGTETQMKALRLITVEQARVGFDRDAFLTLKLIDRNPVEEARACQSIIYMTIRPSTIRPTEPQPEELLPPVKGPWPPITNPAGTRRVINQILRYVTEKESIDDQVRLLLLIGGSRLMCDPEIYNAFKKAVKALQEMDELVRRPILNLLEDPESEVIRASLGMPPLPKNREKVVDPALDDWEQPFGSLAVDVLELNPELLNSITTQQTVRALMATTQSCLFASRRPEAIETLKNAFLVARRQVQPIDRISNFLVIAEQQITANDVLGARQTLQEIGLPGSSRPDPEDDETDPTVEKEADRIFTDERLSRMARLQVIARYFDDALPTIRLIRSESLRDEDYSFLVDELIRIRHLEDAETAVTRIVSAPMRKSLRHRLAIAQGKTGEHYVALRLPDPQTIDTSEKWTDLGVRLLRLGLFVPAEAAAKHVGNTQKRSDLLSRIVREQMLLFSAYQDRSELHRSVRGKLLDWSLETVEEIDSPLVRTQSLLAIINAFLPFSGEQNREIVRTWIDDATASCRRIGPENVGEQAELLSRLVGALVTLTATDASPTAPGPLFDRTKNQEEYNKIKNLFDEAVETVNRTGYGHERGKALANLAREAARLGMSHNTKLLIEETVYTAEEIADKTVSSAVLLELVPTLVRIGDREAAGKVCEDAFSVVSEAFLAAQSDSAAFLWRLRDGELDQIVRRQLEYGFLNEAVGHVNQIRDPAIKDRLLRAAAYLNLKQKNFDAAEISARRITVEEVRRLAVRDVMFMKRLSARSEQSNEASAAP